MAVNAYDESRDKVAAFAKKRSLRHPILLQGKAVSKRFFVRGMPAHYWVDRDGRILASGVGFRPGGERVLEATLRRYLAKRPAPGKSK